MTKFDKYCIVSIGLYDNHTSDYTINAIYSNHIGFIRLMSQLKKASGLH